jgi:hypothetical protein
MTATAAPTSNGHHKESRIADLADRAARGEPLFGDGPAASGSHRPTPARRSPVRALDRRGRCGPDIITTLAEAAEPLMLKDLIAAMETARLIHGESTVKMYLAELMRSGAISHGDAGYFLPPDRPPVAAQSPAQPGADTMPAPFALPPMNLPQLVADACRAQLAEALARAGSLTGTVSSSGTFGGVYVALVAMPLPVTPEPEPLIDTGRRRGRKPGRCLHDIILALNRGPMGYTALVESLAGQHHENTVKANLKRLRELGFIRRDGGAYSLPDE